MACPPSGPYAKRPNAHQGIRRRAWWRWAGPAAIGTVAIGGALMWIRPWARRPGQTTLLPGWLQAAAPPVREAYDFALARPDILSYIPCYCGCEGVGHTSNRDCFLHPQSTAASPRYDKHALG